MEISVIVPVCNEEENLEELVERINETLKKEYRPEEYEIILIDDFSTDNSLKIMKQLSQKYPQVHYFIHNKRKGQGGCFETGFKNASGKIIITLDADLQVFPEDIPTLIKPLREDGYELVNALRKNRKDRISIKISSYLYNILMKIFFASPVSDAASNFTAIKAEFVKNLSLQKNDHRYIIPILQSRGLKKITEVAVRHQERKRGKSKYTLKKSIYGVPELISAYLRIKNQIYK